MATAASSANGHRYNKYISRHWESDNNTLWQFQAPPSSSPSRLLQRGGRQRRRPLPPAVRLLLPHQRLWAEATAKVQARQGPRKSKPSQGKQIFLLIYQDNEGPEFQVRPHAIVTCNAKNRPPPPFFSSFSRFHLTWNYEPRSQIVGSVRHVILPTSFGVGMRGARRRSGSTP